MLGKLLKYEIKSTARTMLPLYAALLVMTIINKIFISINSDATGFMISFGISGTLYGCIIAALVVLTLVIIIQRFYKNLMTDEGYLMFTLPVPIWQQIVAKLLIALTWIIVCILVFALSIFILAADGNTFMYMGQFFSEMGHGMGMLTGSERFQIIWVFIEFIVLGLLCTVTGILQIYSSIAIGQLFGTHKVIASFGAYIVINIILQIIGTIIMVSFAFSSSMTNTLNQLFGTMDAMAGMGALQLFIGIATIINLVLSGLFFFGTHYILKNKLNLE